MSAWTAFFLNLSKIRPDASWAASSSILASCCADKASTAFFLKLSRTRADAEAGLETCSNVEIGRTFVKGSLLGKKEWTGREVPKVAIGFGFEVGWVAAPTLFGASGATYGTW